MLKAPVRKVGGVGTVVAYETMSISEAWKRFGTGNGVYSLEALRERTRRYAARRATEPVGDDYEIGCVILRNCKFWDEADYLDPEEDLGTPMPDQVVTFKYVAAVEAGTAAAEVGMAAAEAAESAVEHHASGQGFAGSQAVKKAIEVYAMEMAKEYYEARGFTVFDRSGNHPFDLECRKGGERLLVEVKGTQTHGDEIILTYNEVALARDGKSRMALFVQHDVDLRDDRGRVVASGGETRVVEPWVPSVESLTPIAYRCQLRR